MIRALAWRPLQFVGRILAPFVGTVALEARVARLERELAADVGRVDRARRRTGPGSILDTFAEATRR